MNTEQFDQNMAQFEAKLLELTARMDKWEQTYMNRFEQPDSSSSEMPKDYSHLLPEGYEFCEEEMAEYWIKVKNPTEANPLGHIWQLDKRPHLAFIDEYRPIRKTASYQVDWSDAPEWADVHAFDEDGKGFWHGIEIHATEWCNFRSEKSPFTLPDGLDWKLSKTFRPQ
jgi:hypothetical protein